MNLSAVLRSEWLRPLTRLAAAWGVWASLGLAAASPLRAEGPGGPITPAGTVVTNQATVTYSTANGDVVATASAVSFTVGQVAGVDVEPPRVSMATPRLEVVLPHLLSNVGNGADRFGVGLVTSLGSSGRVFHDVDNDGLLSAADTLLAGPVSLAMGDTYPILVVVVVTDQIQPGETELVSVTATSQFDGSTDVVVDELRAPPMDITPSIEKQVDRTQGAPDDLITYTLRVRLDGSGTRDSVLVVDDMPSFATYAAGTLQIDGVSVTDAADGDAGEYQAGTLRVDLSSLGYGVETRILFQARIDASAPVGAQVSNTADLLVHTPMGTLQESASATTQVAAPDLRITKSVLGPDPTTAGDSLVYTIEVTNPSATLRAVDVAIVDTLPQPLLLRSTQPAATAAGSEMTWTLPRLEAGETATFQVVVEVPAVSQPTSVVNRAHLSAEGFAGDFAESAARELLPTIDARLSVSLASEIVEVQVGEILPLRAGIVNDGEATVAEVVARLALPRGTRFVPETLPGEFTGQRSSPLALVGVAGPAAAPALAAGDQTSPIQLDSVEVVGDTLLVHVPGELRPGESLVFRYELVVLSAPAEGLLSSIAATARRGDALAPWGLVVAAAPAQVLVGLARNRPLETRTVIGKVFHDVDGDGVQDADEPGIAGVDVVTEDGEVVTTDAFGKLSFNNLRPGRHAFRVDPLSVPEHLALRTVGPRQRLQVVEITGWNSPRLSFALDARSVDDDGPAASAMPADTGTPEVIRVDALRTAEDRAADEGRAFLRGPAIRIHAPEDGYVAPSNRLYLGVQGEPLRPVALFRGDSLLAEAQLLPNGVGDFVGVSLVPGPQRFRVRMRNSWGNEVWDSLVVHRTGKPVHLESESARLELVADGRTTSTVRVRLLDHWGVPVVNQPFATVSVVGGSVRGADVDPSSVGHQLRADEAGWLTIELVGGRESGRGELVVDVPDASLSLPLTVLPEVRPLMLTGVGQVSVGSAGDDFGALTAQGRIDASTALTLSFDSRRLDQGRDVFGRSFDPLEDGRQPILGDASTQRALTPSRYRFAARVERGLDWLSFGDVQTSGFSDGLELARYGRSLPGAAARVTTGDVVWNAFGASTTQALRQQQLRGTGSSGPFELGRGVLPGTEEVRVQVRALENPTRIMSDQLLTRYVEYQIDYERGTLLLKQPVPAADPFGNPVYLLITYEGEAGGDHNPVWGVRGSTDLGDLLGHVADSVPLSMSFVSDAQPGSSFRLGALRTGMVATGGAQLIAEVALADRADSTGVATRIRGAAPLFDDRLKLSAEWTHVGREFSNPADIALRPGTQEIRSAAALGLAAAKVTLSHEQQSFGERGLERRRTALGYEHEVREDLSVEARVAAEGTESTAESASSGAGEYKATWSATSRLDVFAEGRNELWASGSGLANRGAYYGGGASFELAQGFSLEARHLRVSPSGSDNPYNLTSIGVTSELRSGTKAWGAYQISGGIDGRTNAAVVGLNHRFHIGPAWRFSTMLERRKGVGGATIGDPVLSAPFERPEENYTALGFGTEYLPQSKPYRASLRTELRDGNLSSSRLATLAGDVSFGGNLALLSRQELVERDLFDSQTTRYTRERSSLWGLAYRPTRRDDLNMLLKFGWKDAINPFGSGVLASDGEESRLIGAVEAIWAPLAELEVGARFATRTTRLSAQPMAGISTTTRSQADFMGLRGTWWAGGWVGVELEARGMRSDVAPGAVWDVAPSVVARPLEVLEVELGHRFGDLQDPDFAVRSGDGWFLTLGTRVTEDVISTAASFWRSRFGS